MPYIKRDQMKQILENAPPGVDKAQIVIGLVNRGNIIEGYNDQNEERTGIKGFAQNLTRSTQGIAPEIAKGEGKTGLLGQVIGFGKGLVNSIKESGETASNVFGKIPSQPSNPLSPLNTLGRAANLAGKVSEQIPKLQPKGVDERQGSAIEKIAEFFIPVGGASREVAPVIGAAKTKSALKNILETISEPITKRGTRVALQEGRVERGKSILGLFKKPDKILPTERTQRAAQTVLEEIPKANKFNDQQVILEADKAISRIAEPISSELKQVPLQKSKVIELVDQYKKIETELMGTAFDQAEKNAVESMTNTFKNAVGDFVDADNLDDAWKIRQKFDEAIPQKIKQANSQSSLGDQAAKDAWLTYRELINTIVEEGGQEIADETTKQAFKKMTDLYTAKGNIIARATFDKKGNRNGIDTLLKVGSGAGLLAGANAALDRISGQN